MSIADTVHALDGARRRLAVAHPGNTALAV
jgi:hypothetical protein